MLLTIENCIPKYIQYFGVQYMKKIIFTFKIIFKEFRQNK